MNIIKQLQQDILTAKLNGEPKYVIQKLQQQLDSEIHIYWVLRGELKKNELC